MTVRLHVVRIRMRAILFFAFLFCSCVTFSVEAREVVNIYTWADYIPADLIKKFEKETGIQVNYSEFDSNEMLYTRLKSNPKLGYDVIFPSSYYVQRMVRENMLKQLDKAQLSHFRHLNPSLLNLSFDPQNHYSVPYTWGTTGIVVNRKYFNPHKINGWSDFWDPTLKNQLLIFDDMRQFFAIALLQLGYSVNDTDQSHIEKAYNLLKKLRPNIKLFSVEAAQNIYVDEDAHIGMGLSGEVYNAITENPDLTYIYPKEGFELWIDCMAIPVNAPHPKSAQMFINFILRPDVAKRISLYTGFSTPNLVAISLLPKKMAKSEILNPSGSLIQRGKLFVDLGKTNAVYEYYWNRLKIGE